MSELLLSRLLSGDLDADVTSWLVAGFETWQRGGGALDLCRCLHLPASPAQAARAIRDQWLIAAASELDGGPWERSKALADAIRRDARRQREPATRIEVCLEQARRSGATVDLTPRRLLSIITEAESARDFAPLRVA